MPTIQANELQSFAEELFVAAKVPAEEARIVAGSLVGSNLRGHDSHGVMRIPYYVQFVREGRIHPGASLETLSETPAALACDGGWGFGQVQVPRLFERLGQKARGLGVACGSLRRAGHIGRVGEYAELAAASSLAMLAMVNTHGSGPRVAPPGTSVVAEGKVRVHRIAGTPCPPGWLLDPEGRPTTDPNQLYVDPPGSILPMGGDQAYKGFGLALTIDMLAGGLSGGWCSRPNPEPPLGNDALFMLLDPARLGVLDHFLTEVTNLSAHVRSCPTVEGVGEILLPGDPERRTLAYRSVHGIPLDEGNWGQLTGLARELGVPLLS